ncbi:hypothetical protein Fot_39300 [Forsythia ovata]|uniref:Uncharacterized protein n=1 Tax=Forsythia ovata TaxID=205694 RepID=A0ABD1S466_9LAMI
METFIVGTGHSTMPVRGSQLPLNVDESSSISLGFWVFEGKEYMLHLPVCKIKEWLLIDVLSEEADQEQLNTHIIQAGKALLELAFTNEELLQELEVVFLSTEIRMCLIWFMDDLADVYWQA